MHCKFLLLILLTTLTTTATLCATDLRGRVDGPSGPLAGTSVALFSKANNSFVLLHSTTTGPGGLYYFNEIAPGEYVVQIEGKNYGVHVGPGPQQDVGPIRAGGAAATATPLVTPTPVATATHP